MGLIPNISVFNRRLPLAVLDTRSCMRSTLTIFSVRYLNQAKLNRTNVGAVGGPMAGGLRFSAQGHQDLAPLAREADITGLMYVEPKSVTAGQLRHMNQARRAMVDHALTFSFP